jgi:hypothetical protein
MRRPKGSALDAPKTIRVLSCNVREDLKPKIGVVEGTVQAVKVI